MKSGTNPTFVVPVVSRIDCDEQRENTALKEKEGVITTYLLNSDDGLGSLNGRTTVLGFQWNWK
jgi:hypothetical protein